MDSMQIWWNVERSYCPCEAELQSWRQCLKSGVQTSEAAVEKGPSSFNLLMDAPVTSINYSLLHVF